MGVIRAEPARMTDWAARSIGAAWRAFDLQLAAYAGLLAILGLVMAYTNSVEQGQAVLSSGTTFVRGLMWTGIALIAFVDRDRVRLQVAQDLRLAALRCVQLGLLVVTLAIGHGVGGVVALDLHRAVRLPVQRARQDPDDRRPRELPRRAPGPAPIAAVDPRRVRPRRPAVDPRHAPAGPRDVARPARDPRRDAVHVRGAACVWLGAIAGARPRFAAAHLELHPARLPEARINAFLNPATDTQGAGYQLYQSQIAVGSGGLTRQRA